MKVIAIATAALLSFAVSSAQAETIQEMVTRKAADHGVPIKLAHAVILTESGYNPKVRGQRGEYGLGQILCRTAKGEGFKGNCNELTNPETNLEYSMLYLREALDAANGDVCGASTLYSAGLMVKPGKSAYCRLILKRMEKL